MLLTFESASEGAPIEVTARLYNTVSWMKITLLLKLCVAQRSFHQYKLKCKNEKDFKKPNNDNCTKRVRGRTRNLSPVSAIVRVVTSGSDLELLRKNARN